MLRSCVNFVFLLTLLSASSCREDDHITNPRICDKSDVSSPKLISVKDANQLLMNHGNIIPIEVSNENEYDSGHLKNAVNVWRPDFRSKVFSTYKGMICSENELESFLQNLGVKSESQLLIYDNKGGCDAMRLAWVFDYYGVSNYQVINGGKTAWIQSGYFLDTIDVSPIHNQEFTLPVDIDTSLCADMSDVQEALKNPNTIIVDTRELYEYLGNPFIAENKVWPYKKGAFARGCIPEAIHLNWSELSDLANDHRIKCTNDLIYNLERKGITKDKNIIVYCQSGSRSSHTAFVLREILKYPNVKNYDGSWIEWSYYHKNGTNVPIAKLTSDEKFEALEKELNKSVLR